MQLKCAILTGTQRGGFLKPTILDIITSFERTADQFFSKEELRARLKSSRPQRIKYTIDIKTEHLHIGHAVNLWMMRRLQERGHKAVIVFTDFTSRQGDDDGRLETIKSYPTDTIDRKIRALTAELYKILHRDPALLEIRRNSEWYGLMGMQDMMNIFSLVTHAKLISSDAFQLRIAEGRELYINEMLFPVLQGYDSYKVASDITIIGTDQLFNESIGRFLQEKHKQRPQTMITTRMTPGIDGRTKQSQRRDNDVPLSATPRDKFGRIMSIPDELINDYFLIYTDVPHVDLVELEALAASDPREAKARLATAIVARYHGDKAAADEREWFDNTISRGYMPDEMPTLAVAADQIEALDLVCLARPDKSRSDSRRLITQGGVELNGRKIRKHDQMLAINTNDVLQVGRRQWFRIEVVGVGTFETERLNIHAAKVEDIDAIIAHLPTLEMAEYILGRKLNEKLTPASYADALKRIVLQPEKSENALFVVRDKTQPDAPLGVVSLQWPAGAQWIQQVWLTPEADADPQVQEAMRSLGKHALEELDIETAAFKNAFTFATVPSALHDAQRGARVDVLMRHEPIGMPMYTREGWQKLKEWRHSMRPWSLETHGTEEARMAARTQAQKAQKSQRTPKFPGLTPSGGGRDDTDA